MPRAEASAFSRASSLADLEDDNWIGPREDGMRAGHLDRLLNENARGIFAECPQVRTGKYFTAKESRIMKAGTGFAQSYNAQPAVEVESRLIVGGRVSQAPNDKRELESTLDAIPQRLHRLGAGQELALAG